MTKFITTLFLFFLIFFVIEKGLIPVRNMAPEREIDKRLEWILNGGIHADILIYGSSRGSRDIIASQIGDSLNRTAFNLSYQGSAIAFHEFLLSQTLANRNTKPELVILVVDDPSELLPNSRMNFRLDRLYPLVKYNVVRNKLIERGDKNFWLSQLFIVHQLNISNFDIRNRNFSRLDTLLKDGSMPITFSDPRFTGNPVYATTEYDQSSEIPAQVQSFLHFIDLCDKNLIKLLIISPPNFYPSTKGFNERIKTLAGEKAHFLRYDTLPGSYLHSPEFYYDDVHLKKNGAILFTGEIIRYIQKNKLI